MIPLDFCVKWLYTVYRLFERADMEHRFDRLTPRELEAVRLALNDFLKKQQQAEEDVKKLGLGSFAPFQSGIATTVGLVREIEDIRSETQRQADALLAASALKPGPGYPALPRLEAE